MNIKRMDEGLARMLQYENVAWYEKGCVKILDRRIYPIEVKFVTCHHYTEVAQAISDMVTQSAGPYTAAGMGMALAAYEARLLNEKDQYQFLLNAAECISSARPTTKDRLKQVVTGCLSVAKDNLGKNCDQAIFQYTLQAMNNRYARIDRVACELIKKMPKDARVMTQCFGETIIGMMIRQAQKNGINLKMVCPETRPFLQGARFTASCARDMGIDVTVITDNMPAFYMAHEKVDLFTSAADVICMDGSIINKVGTLQIAICAKYFNIPYYCTGIPDLNHPDAKSVDIEFRDPEETLSAHHIKHTLEGVKGYYPAFDITPPSLVSEIITDQGAFLPDALDGYKADQANFYNFAV